MAQIQQGSNAKHILAPMDTDYEELKTGLPTEKKPIIA
jgi:hypothetical protein